MTMKTRLFLLALLFAASFFVRADAATLSLNGNSWTTRLSSIQWIPNSPTNDFIATFVFLDAGGNVVRLHAYLCKGDNTGVYDETGFQVSATTPLTLRTDATTTQSDFDTVMTNAIAGGKVKP
jgi:hypothetical protein